MLFTTKNHKLTKENKKIQYQFGYIHTNTYLCRLIYINFYR